MIPLADAQPPSLLLPLLPHSQGRPWIATSPLIFLRGSYFLSACLRPAFFPLKDRLFAPHRRRPQLVLLLLLQSPLPLLGLLPVAPLLLCWRRCNLLFLRACTVRSGYTSRSASSRLLASWLYERRLQWTHPALLTSALLSFYLSFPFSLLSFPVFFDSIVIVI